jgi:WD40 repeat protein
MALSGKIFSSIYTLPSSQAYIDRSSAFCHQGVVASFCRITHSFRTGHKNAVVEVHWTSDGERIVSASADKSVGGIKDCGALHMHDRTIRQTRSISMMLIAATTDSIFLQLDWRVLSHRYVLGTRPPACK